mmetsp:Transcript_53845/g.127122  ORF Transcript_53845/g.127122 Transcript_53845/m.127122 type:complete len:110 (+) Transcript_53845:155-484(+)
MISLRHVPLPSTQLLCCYALIYSSRHPRSQMQNSPGGNFRQASFNTRQASFMHTRQASTMNLRQPSFAHMPSGLTTQQSFMSEPGSPMPIAVESSQMAAAPAWQRSNVC